MDEKQALILYESLKPRIIADGDLRYRKIEDCDQISDQAHEKYSADHLTLELLKSDMATFKKIGWLLVSASIGQLIISLAGNIMR